MPAPCRDLTGTSARDFGQPRITSCLALSIMFLLFSVLFFFSRIFFFKLVKVQNLLEMLNEEEKRTIHRCSPTASYKGLGTKVKKKGCMLHNPEEPIFSFFS